MLLERLNGKPENVEFDIPCMSDYVGVVRLAVSGLATRMNFSIEEIEDIKIAVSRLVQTQYNAHLINLKMNAYLLLSIYLKINSKS